jgi:hypothetical protein
MGHLGQGLLQPHQSKVVKQADMCLEDQYTQEYSWKLALDAIGHIAINKGGIRHQLLKTENIFLAGRHIKQASKAPTHGIHPFSLTPSSHYSKVGGPDLSQMCIEQGCPADAECQDEAQRLYNQSAVKYVRLEVMKGVCRRNLRAMFALLA